jgi:transcriptional regulator with XRE-family HTH domain
MLYHGSRRLLAKLSTEEYLTLGSFLKRARKIKALSLRDVERATTISNGYLSLIESDKVKTPSPNFLYQLGNLYDVSYSELMRLAGYAVPERADATQPQLAHDDWLAGLTDDERAQVSTFVRFLRASRVAKS